jgi:lipoprotein-releasing system permease protein
LISQIEKTIALRYLKPRRNDGFLRIIKFFSFTGIALGVAILIIVMSVMNGFRAELVEKILGFSPHITIKPYDQKIELNKINELEKHEEIINKSVRSYSGEAVIFSKNNTKGIIVRGYSKNDLEQMPLLKDSIIDGSLNDFESNSVSIGKDLAIASDIIVGDKIQILSTASIETPFGNLPTQSDYIVTSVFSSGLSDFDGNVIFMPIDEVLPLFGVPEEEIRVEIFLKSPEKIELIKEDIQNLFSEHYVYSWADLNKSFFAALKVERNVMFIILTLIIVVAAFNIISGLTILVKNKTKDIALLRTIGVSRKSIVKIFFLTGFLIGFFATLSGVIFGVLFSFYVEEIRELITFLFNIQLFPEEIYFLSKMPSEINIISILIISGFSLTITIFASLFPSLAAAKLDPVRALKYE